MAFTPTINLDQPTISNNPAKPDQWGGRMNANWDKVDTAFAEDRIGLADHETRIDSLETAGPGGGSLAENVLYVPDAADLPPDNTSATEGRIAFTLTPPKIWRDDGEFWVDQDISGSVFLKLNELSDPDGDVDFAGEKAVNVGGAQNDGDAVNRGYLNDALGVFGEGYAPVDHTHDYSATTHTHDAAAIVSGTIDPARLPAVSTAAAEPYALVFNRAGYVALRVDGVLVTKRMKDYA